MAAALIKCPACGNETFLRHEPLYDGFQRAGETLSCVECGHTFASESDVPYVESKKPRIFTDADRTKRIDLFTSDEKGRNCRHCKHYVKNPFVQRCGLHQIEVQATDCCEHFEKKPEGDTAEDDPLAKLLRGKD